MGKKTPDPTPIRRRPRAVARKFLTQNDSRIGLLLYPEKTDPPRTRADCPVERPCGYVSCRYNLYLDVTEAGSVVVPEHEPWEQAPAGSCALDIAERGGSTLAEVAVILGVTRERVRQIEVAATAKAKRAVEGEIDEASAEPWNGAYATQCLKGDLG